MVDAPDGDRPARDEGKGVEGCSGQLRGGYEGNRSKKRREKADAALQATCMFNARGRSAYGNNE